MGTVAENVRKERRPWATSIFSLSVETEQADAGQDGHTCLARSIPQARTGP